MPERNPVSTTQEPAALVEAAGLDLAYDRRVVLRNVHWSVPAGSFWFVLGPNGEGKTTLLKAVLGLLPPRAGAIRLSPALCGRERIGFVPQRGEVNPALPTTVREFVLLGLVGLRVHRSDAEGRLAAALGAVGLHDLAARNLLDLSGGQRQRALLARALIRRPQLLILDEPTNGLDLSTEDALLRALADLNRGEGITMIVVTHDLPIAARYATHVALVRQGEVVAGPRDEVLTTEHLERVYDAPVHLYREAGGALSVAINREERGP